MWDQLADRAPVGDHEALESPFALEDSALQVDAGGGRRTADLVEGVHQRCDARFDRRPERRQHDVAQRALGDVDGVVVAAAFGEAIAGVVLGAGGDGVGGGEIVALKAPHPCDCHLCPQVGILTCPLHDPPARVAGDVDHRRERPMEAGGRRFGGRYPGRGLDRLEVPAGRLGWDR